MLPFFVCVFLTGMRYSLFNDETGFVKAALMD